MHISVLNTLKNTYQKKILRGLGPMFFLLFLLQPIFYQSGRPSPIRRAPLLHLCSSGPECIPCPLPHMVGSQWLDAWLLMIEPSLVNRCYHLCKPLPVPFAHRPLGRCKRRNYLITKKKTQHEIQDWMIIECSILDLKMRKRKHYFLDLYRQATAVSSSDGLFLNLTQDIKLALCTDEWRYLLLKNPCPSDRCWECLLIKKQK